MNEKRLRIECRACGAESFLKREPVYEGFRRIGERLYCGDCGHAYRDEADVPFAAGSRPRIFTAADRSPVITIFASTDAARNCRHCRHYVVNPFIQRCGIHHREVQATDVCERFTAAPAEDA